jgi:Helix-hairpin-helix domain
MRRESRLESRLRPELAAPLARSSIAWLALGVSNADIADRLASLAQLMAAGKENPYKVKAYQRAAARIRTWSESIDELVREDADLTTFAGIGNAIAASIREIVRTGTLGKLEKLRATASPEIAGNRPSGFCAPWITGIVSLGAKSQD